MYIYRGQLIVWMQWKLCIELLYSQFLWDKCSIYPYFHLYLNFLSLCVTWWSLSTMWSLSMEWSPHHHTGQCGHTLSSHSSLSILGCSCVAPCSPKYWKTAFTTHVYSMNMDHKLSALATLALGLNKPSKHRDIHDVRILPNDMSDNLT